MTRRASDGRRWDEAEREEPTFRLTALSDVSANIFAAFLLILLTLLASGDEFAPHAPISVENRGSSHLEKPIIIPHRAIAPADLVVHMLYERLMSPQGVSLDLRADGVHIRADGRTRWIAAADTSALTQAAREFPRVRIRIFVIAHGSYRNAIDALTQADLQWDEISVPDALCAPDRSDWSEAFFALEEANPTFQGFKTALSRLLTTRRGPVASERLWNDNRDAVVEAARLRDALDSLKSSIGALRLLACAAVLFVCIGFIAWIETRAPRFFTKKLMRSPEKSV